MAKLYYDIGEILSHKCLLNFDTGARGTGKTYGFKKWAIDDFLKTGKQFVYMRRYKTELTEVDKMWADIEDKYPEHKFAVKGKKFMIDDKEAGYAIPLSVALTKKSIPYPKVNKLLFDEFIIPKGHIRYLPNEVFSFLEMYETINRMRIDEHGEELGLNDLLRVFFFANNVSLMNPYYMYLNSFPIKGKRFTKPKDDVIIGVYDNTTFKQTKMKTRFAKIVEGTPYGDYAINNDLYQDNDSFIRERTNDSRMVFIITYKDTDIGFWFDYKNGWIFASRKFNSNCKLKFAITSEDHKENYFLITRVGKNQLIKNMIDGFKNGLMFFEDDKTKAITMMILASLITK